MTNKTSSFKLVSKSIRIFTYFHRGITITNIGVADKKARTFQFGNSHATKGVKHMPTDQHKNDIEDTKARLFELINSIPEKTVFRNDEFTMKKGIVKYRLPNLDTI